MDVSFLHPLIDYTNSTIMYQSRCISLRLNPRRGSVRARGWVAILCSASTSGKGMPSSIPGYPVINTPKDSVTTNGSYLVHHPGAFLCRSPEGLRPPLIMSTSTSTPPIQLLSYPCVHPRPHHPNPDEPPGSTAVFIAQSGITP